MTVLITVSSFPYHGFSTPTIAACEFRGETLIMMAADGNKCSAPQHKSIIM